jgi:hypothetical protein
VIQLPDLWSLYNNEFFSHNQSSETGDHTENRFSSDCVYKKNKTVFHRVFINSSSKLLPGSTASNPLFASSAILFKADGGVLGSDARKS